MNVVGLRAPTGMLKDMGIPVLHKVSAHEGK